MLMPRRLECHLERKHIPYAMIFHAPADSAQMSASAMHLPGKEVAKAVELKADTREILAVLPASYRINFEKLSAIVGARVRLMDEEAFSELFPDCEPGVISPFRELTAYRFIWTKRWRKIRRSFSAPARIPIAYAWGVWISCKWPNLTFVRSPRGAEVSMSCRLF